MRELIITFLVCFGYGWLLGWTREKWHMQNQDKHRIERVAKKSKHDKA